jgi:PKHD-type hydroxylase
MQITEPAQYTEYPAGGFYDWHMDSDVDFKHEPTVRKISMTCLLSHESEFEGGGLELMSDGKIARPKQGQAIFFASFIRHRVIPITKGIRKSLVMWFGGPPLK